jgi:2-polyprenyl-3-methyl-5-hydroxy-6-metoxy-1,4-benzoquinol methylase
MTAPTERDIAQYFDEGVDCCAPRRDASKRSGVALAGLLRKNLRAAGLENKNVLELGCGRGELSLELIEDGAAMVIGIDLSADAIEYAQRIAREDELSNRLEFRVGNAATLELPPQDAVVHHRTICCYPDSTVFLASSVGAAGSIYAFSMPRSHGIWGLVMRFALQFENVVHRFKRRGFRAYVHDERIVDAALTEAGFRLRGRSNRRGWFAAVYVK